MRIAARSAPQWRPQWRRWRRWRACLAAAALVTVIGALAWLRCGPLPDGLLDGPAVRSTVVRDRNGVILHEARADDGTRQVRLEADALPEQLVKATLAAEDHRFRRHPGVDPIAIARAAMRNVWSGSREGGSTITQQTVKLLLARRDPRQGADARAKLEREDRRSDPRAAARTPADQARDSRALSERRVVRQSARGRRTRQPRLLRHRPRRC